ncbi:MAG TPA: outer membrane protein assembly factor BamD [Polyangiaceae bacterium]|nr:outer membrane protein assembly factor BamD [Polyangiaceae bacterium]
MLDPVRTSLARHDAPAALRQLDVFDRAFPASVLADEALVLRVDALVARGDRAEAEALGRSFLATHPASPHAPHLLRQLGGTHNP